MCPNPNTSMNNTTTKTRTTRGRQKIEIKKIENVANRQVTFTKRRGGLFKKAAELCVLTAAEAAVIVKSPGGRTFAFGHPSVSSVIERYLGGGGSGGGSLESSVTEDLTRGFSGRYDEVANELAAEKRRREIITGSDKPKIGFWWEEPIDGFGLDELEAYMAALEELKKKVNIRADEMMLVNASNSMLSMNSTIRSENNSNDLGYSNHLINQPHYPPTSTSSLVPYGFTFGHGHTM